MEKILKEGPFQKSIGKDIFDDGTVNFYSVINFDAAVPDGSNDSEHSSSMTSRSKKLSKFRDGSNIILK